MDTGTQISNKIISLATERGADKSVCPSEIARALFDTGWRSHMDDVRAAAIALQHNGRVIITQKGNPVNTGHIKGPIRIKIV